MNLPTLIKLAGYTAFAAASGGVIGRICFDLAKNLKQHEYVNVFALSLGVGGFVSSVMYAIENKEI
jgi:hypothetical protein